MIPVDWQTDKNKTMKGETSKGKKEKTKQNENFSFQLIMIGPVQLLTSRLCRTSDRG